MSNLDSVHSKLIFACFSLWPRLPWVLWCLPKIQQNSNTFIWWWDSTFFLSYIQAHSADGRVEVFPYSLSFFFIFVRTLPLSPTTIPQIDYTPHPHTQTHTQSARISYSKELQNVCWWIVQGSGEKGLWPADCNLVAEFVLVFFPSVFLPSMWDYIWNLYNFC